MSPEDETEADQSRLLETHRCDNSHKMGIFKTQL